MEQMKTTPEQEAVCCCHKKKERDEKEYKDLMNGSAGLKDRYAA